MIWIVLIIGAILRFVNLSSLSFSNDELSSLTRLKYSSVGEMIEKGVYIDFHPAGVQLFMYFWVKLFGDGVFMFRLPFVLFGLGSIYLIYSIGKKWFNETTAICAAAVFSFLPFTIQYTQFARMYSPGIFFSLLACYGWMHWLFSDIHHGRTKYWWLWVIATVACLHIHYFSFAFAALLGLSGLIFIKKHNVQNYLLGGTLALLTFIPELKIFAAQMKTGDIGGWLGAPESTFLFSFFWEVFNHSGILILIVLGLMTVGIFKSIDVKSKWRWLCLSWFLLSFILAYIYSVLGHPVLQYSTLLFTLPFLLLFIFSFLPDDFLQKKFSTVSLYLFFGFMIYSTISSGYYKTPRFGVFKEVAADVSQLKMNYGSNVPFVINVVNPEYFLYYAKDQATKLNLIYKIETDSELAVLSSIVDTSSSDYFGYAWTNSSHPDEIVSIISSKFPMLISCHSYFNASVYLFGKKAGKPLPIVFSNTCDFETETWSRPDTQLTTKHAASPIHSYYFNEVFSPGIEKKLIEFGGEGYRVVTFSAKIFPIDEIKEAVVMLEFRIGEDDFRLISTAVKHFVHPGKFATAVISSPIPKYFHPEDVVRAYISNQKGERMYIDDLQLTVREESDPYEIEW